MTIRVAAIEVSHWHALHDAAYLRHLIAMPDVELVAIQVAFGCEADMQTVDRSNQSDVNDPSATWAAQDFRTAN